MPAWMVLSDPRPWPVGDRQGNLLCRRFAIAPTSEPFDRRPDLEYAQLPRFVRVGDGDRPVPF
ncbi:hypothetical protein [Oxynema aestuarii]|uniref:Uncharacterized protein n=1 Tax=Oxynema aestuarii AP17 TaxID=2064643 RepID=A0A6H1TSR9_9CYAN|nr:hypothetical protein [Oxynema aestuarii]QIZ69256.1 hypothetical protein HCG48_00495 [Oxynema aestuarii AP17]RMH75827.1 MAG: hypothetical protein D6680_10470 [Cyanobacteria bacterium J007]